MIVAGLECILLESFARMEELSSPAKHGTNADGASSGRSYRSHTRRRRRSLLRIVHERGAIPNEMGPTRCRATPALTNQPTRP